MKILKIDFSLEDGQYSFKHRGRKYTNKNFFRLACQAVLFGYTNYLHRGEFGYFNSLIAARRRSNYVKERARARRGG